MAKKSAAEGTITFPDGRSFEMNDPALRPAMAEFVASFLPGRLPATKELKLAIADPEIGPLLRNVRIFPPAEATLRHRYAAVKAVMEAAEALDPDTEKGRKNRAKLEIAMEKVDVLFDLEKEWLSDDERRRFGMWLDEDDFIVLTEAELILRYVVEHYRDSLAGFRIAIVAQKEIPAVNRRGRLGTATKLPGKLRYLAEWDAVITIDFGRWARLSDRDRQRLIHHELEHLDLNDERTGLRLRSHDFEDFASVIELYGLRSESGAFSTDGESADVLERWGAQLELLPKKAA